MVSFVQTVTNIAMSDSNLTKIHVLKGNFQFSSVPNIVHYLLPLLNMPILPTCSWEVSWTVWCQPTWHRYEHSPCEFWYEKNIHSAILKRNIVPHSFGGVPSSVRISAADLRSNFWHSFTQHAHCLLFCVQKYCYTLLKVCSNLNDLRSILRCYTSYFERWFHRFNLYL